LRRHREHLEELVKERTLDLETMNIQLEKEISERKRSEIELRKSEERFRTSVENMLDGFAILSTIRDYTGHITDFRYVYINEALCQINQETREEQIGHTLLELRPAYKDMGLFHEYVQLVETGRPVIKESWVREYVYEGGIERRQIFDFRAVKLGDGIAVAVRDVTERKNAEDARIKSEERYHHLVENAPGIVYSFSDKRGGIYYSSRVEEILGYSPQYLYQNPFLWNSSIHPDDRPHVALAIDDLKTGTEYTIEYRIRDREGIWHVFVDRSIDILREGDETIIDRMAADITERKRDEEEKKGLEIQLIQAQKMEALGKLAGGIAHDLNNILQPILINSELISDKLPQGTEEREYLDQIIEVAQLGKNLIKQIKLFGSSQKPRLELIPIGQVVQKALTMVKRTLSSDIKLYQRINMNEQLVNADPIQINQLVLNLCSNAEHSMTPHGGTLDVTLDETAVTESTPAIGNDLKPGTYMMLAVTDTGSGIKPEIVKNIFDPFFTIGKSDKGTGLGLAVVSEIVKNSHGSILLHSEVGKGTRFEIFFPLHLDSPK
jgi:two-component system, cell cycle sensor histidine kinase and response regulator CckA